MCLFCCHLFLSLAHAHLCSVDLVTIRIHCFISKNLKLTEVTLGAAAGLPLGEILLQAQIKNDSDTEQG
jgi:hypothetical protein